MNSATLVFFKDGRRAYRTHLDAIVELGRQRTTEPPPFCRLARDDGARIIIASLMDTRISRDHVRLEPTPTGACRITNLSRNRMIGLDRHAPLSPGEDCLVEGGFLVQLEGVAVRVEAIGPEESDFARLASPTLPPHPIKPFAGPAEYRGESFIHTLDSGFDKRQGEVLLAWLRSTMEVFQSAASSPTFLLQAAQAVTRIVGLEHALVLQYDGRTWSVQAEHGATSDASRRLSQRMLDKLVDEKRTFVFRPNADSGESLSEVDAVVAAPILDESGQLAGALYATRRITSSAAEGPPISALEASLVELLACGVAAGWARLRHERAAMKARIQFEQFFGPDLAARLENDPDLLAGRDSEITLMFCDISGFSAISERLPTDLTLQWINAVLDVLSECVIRHRGVLVDYVGDELFAMWGAPFETPQHAELACRAALEMSRKTVELSRAWETRLGAAFGVRIGINSGLARVGNVGSQWKFKYGALGNTVNLAARVRGAAKFVQAAVVVSGSTAAALPDDYPTRRLCQVRTVNIEQPIDLFELPVDSTPAWNELRQGYQEALAAMEQGDWERCGELAQLLASKFPEDGPASVLLRRARTALQRPVNDRDPIWSLDAK